MLFALARETGLEAYRDAMFAGERINNTEDRAVKHWLLRAPLNRADADSVAVHETLEAMLRYAEQVRADTAITDVVNIGIGGSDLGPQMAVAALESFAAPDKRLHFVSNIDGHELAAVLRRVRPASTLFLVASKTFTTLETMTNARSARAWFEAQGGTDIARHFAALTTNVEAARQFGITTTFGFWDWVGGRYSLWSAIGLPIAIAVGAQGFRELLAGAHAMDEHFRTEPLESNLPARLGLLDVWYRNFHGFTSRSIAPYHSALRRLPAYLQQLEMESNGKGVDAQGQPWHSAPRPVLWGEPGTNGQHAYFQMLHQGTDRVPVEFIWRCASPRACALERPPSAAAGQRHRAGAGADAGQGGRGRPQEFPGQSAQHVLRARRAAPCVTRRTAGAVRASRVHRRRRVGHRQLRPVGRGAGQGAGKPAAAASRRRGGQARCGSGAGSVDAGAAGPLG